ARPPRPEPRPDRRGRGARRRRRRSPQREHAQRRQGARRRGDVALPPHRRQGGPARRARRLDLQQDRATGPGRALAPGHGRPGRLGPRRAVRASLGARPDRVPPQPGPRAPAPPRHGARLPPAGRLPRRDRGPRVLGDRRLRLRLRAHRTQPAVRAGRGDGV
ncbi:MAG: Transcriptional regulator, AcrR family, partial [uncultured Pseudonocardia sp.]